jgi:hypothetical protein
MPATLTMQPPKRPQSLCCQGPAALQQQRLARLAAEHAQGAADAESRRLEVAALAAIQVHDQPPWSAQHYPGCCHPQ